MVRSIEKELLQSLRDIIHAHTDSTQEPKQRMHAILTDLYQFLEENSEICTALLSPNGDIAFVAKLQEYVQNSCLQEWLDAQQNHPDAVEQEQFHLQTAFIVSGCVGLCRTWLHRTPIPLRQPKWQLLPNSSSAIMPSSRWQFQAISYRCSHNHHRKPG